VASPGRSFVTPDALVEAAHPIRTLLRKGLTVYDDDFHATDLEREGPAAPGYKGLRHLPNSGGRATPDLLWRQILLVRCKLPAVSERVLDLTPTVAPEHVGK
jgi:hypothetical protein